MTLEEFESKIEEFKREYLTIIKKVGADHIWMAPHKYDWYHSQHFVIDIKRNDELELELSLNVNDIYVQDRTMASRLSELKRYLQKENFKFETIGEAEIDDEALITITTADGETLLIEDDGNSITAIDDNGVFVK